MKRCGFRVVAILLMVFWVSLTGNAGAVETLAILPFENNSITDVEKYAPLSNGLAAMLITDLNKTGTALKVIERHKITSLLKEIALGQAGGVDQSTAIEAGKILGAKSIGFGAFTVMGEMVRIDVRIIRVETSELVMADAVTGQTQDFLALESELASKIATALKTALSGTSPKSKSSIEAALFFSKGINALDAGNQKAANKNFTKAIKLDPKYKIQVQALN